MNKVSVRNGNDPMLFKGNIHKLPACITLPTLRIVRKNKMELGFLVVLGKKIHILLLKALVIGHSVKWV